ncbi:sensor domain-containing diguanylate cyclase [Bacillus niameyensis]|uniref:sensor domain-containing diguanylate cyclase n=1 Tax=Bacillus niameyensis TaxID=1522308 RepID=UPI0007802E01|nr:GGDEF domain-containing protein [Bacillus niameyensis]
MEINQNNSKTFKEIMYRELFRVTDKCYSSMDTNQVLFEIIHTLKKVFPENDAFLLLSHDEEIDSGLPVKNLEFNSGNVLAIAAYVNATIETDHEECPSVFAPLQGKQGVYGVLHVKSHFPSSFNYTQLDFIRLLANTAGNALENAKLYQQSQKLIEDLRLIDEITQKLNSTSTFKETIHYLRKQIMSIFHASDIGYIVLNGDSHYIMRESSSFFHKKYGKLLVKAIFEKAENKSDSLFIGDTSSLLEGIESYVGSLMSVPFQTNSIQGCVILASESPLAFSFEQFRLFQSLVQRSALGMANVILREKLERMVITDYLTRLYARNYLDDAIKVSMEKDREGTFILIDLDDFKEINDKYGHQIGDQVLIQVAEMIKRSIRPNDIAARWGGEELAIYLPSVSLEQGISVAKRLLKSVSQNTNPSVTMSCGISNWTSDKTEEVSQLFSRADSALYEAKSLGKNQIAVRKMTASSEL